MLEVSTSEGIDGMLGVVNGLLLLMRALVFLRKEAVAARPFSELSRILGLWSQEMGVRNSLPLSARKGA